MQSSFDNSSAAATGFFAPAAMNNNNSFGTCAVFSTGASSPRQEQFSPAFEQSSCDSVGDLMLTEVCFSRTLREDRGADTIQEVEKQIEETKKVKEIFAAVKQTNLVIVDDPMLTEVGLFRGSRKSSKC